MQFLPPEQYPLWKTQLRDGARRSRRLPRGGATRLVRIHAATAADPAVAAEFPTDAIFYAIRLEPYLLATAPGASRPGAAVRCAGRRDAGEQARAGAWRRQPEEHPGGPDGPVFLDAECAWWGDPAFDLAFCLNHLLLKCLWTPARRDGFLACFDALAAAYLAGVAWEPPAALEARAAHLLPGLFLARVDGKSPVEYITKRARQGPGAPRRPRVAGSAGRDGSTRCARPGAKELGV